MSIPRICSTPWSTRTRIFQLAITLVTGECNVMLRAKSSCSQICTCLAELELTLLFRRVVSNHSLAPMKRNISGAKASQECDNDPDLLRLGSSWGKHVLDLSTGCGWILRASSRGTAHGSKVSNIATLSFHLSVMRSTQRVNVSHTSSIHSAIGFPTRVFESDMLSHFNCKFQ